MPYAPVCAPTAQTFRFASYGRSVLRPPKPVSLDTVASHYRLAQRLRQICRRLLNAR